MKESVAIAKEADRKKDISSTRSGNSIHRARNEPERQLGSLRGVIGNITRDGGTPSVESIATELSGMPYSDSASALLALQQTHGNRYVQRVVAGIQAKLKVGQPGDIYEQEADRVADAVMRMPEPQVQRQPEEEEEEELIQTKPLADQITPLVQRQVEEKEEEEEILQTKENPGQTPEVPPDFESRIQSLKGGGQLLPESTRAYFEPRFGYDFSQVCIHTDSEAAETAQNLKARAFTVGRDIMLGSGQHPPGTEAGRRLLAHELTHVVQQAGNTHSAIFEGDFGDRSTPLNRSGPNLVRDIREESYRPSDGSEAKLIAHELTHMLQQSMENLRRLEDGAGANQRRKAYEVVQNRVSNITMIQKTDDEGREEAESETREEQELQEINVALYDQNPDHMHPPPRRATELAAFGGWGTSWAGSYGASSHAVNSHGEIREALRDVISELPPEGRIGTIACFGHGSSRTGWLRMGDIGNILIAPDIKNRLSPNLRVILYMCLAGAEPGHGEEIAREPGGINSFAAGLRDRLVGATVHNAEVWAHTVRGVATTSPHWRVFEAPAIPMLLEMMEGEMAGEPFFRTALPYADAVLDFQDLSQCYRGLDEASRESRDRTKEFPASIEDLRNKWMWKFYLNLVTWQDIATRIPMDPEECANEIRVKWSTYFYGDSSVLIPGNPRYDFLRRNDFGDFRPP